MDGLASAVEKAGGQSALAKILHCSPQAIQKWCARGRVPAERVISIESATGVPRHLLRPDLYLEALPNLEANDTPTPEEVAVR